METVNAEAALKNLSPRHQVFLELVQTEINYVNILRTIMTVSTFLQSKINKSVR